MPSLSSIIKNQPFFLRMWYNTKAPTSPNKPSALSEPKIPIIFSTTEMFGQNGIFIPPNSTSSTTPKEIKLIPICVRASAQEPIFFNKSIIFDLS